MSLLQHNLLTHNLQAIMQSLISQVKMLQALSIGDYALQAVLGRTYRCSNIVSHMPELLVYSWKFRGSRVFEQNGL